jgi:hypothetical protein
MEAAPAPLAAAAPAEPAAAAAAAAPQGYTQQYAPGNFKPELIEDTNTPKPLPTRYGDPIYGLTGGKDGIRTLIGRVGMMPVVAYDNRDGPPTVTFVDDPAYQKSQAILDFEKKIASGEVESSGLYGPATDNGRGRKDFVERESAYQSYDPATNIVTFYDPEGNITQQGPRAGSVLGGALGSLMTGFNQTTANPDFQKAVMLAAIAAGGYGALAGGAGAAAAEAGAATSGGGLGSTYAGLGGSPFAGGAALEVPGYVSAAGAGAGAAGAGALPQYSVNQAVASGMNPGSMGAEMAASNWGATTNSLQAGMGIPGLTAEQLAAAYGTTGPGSALYNMATLGNANALTNQLANAGTASNLAKVLGGLGGSQPSLMQTAINVLGGQDQGKNPGGMLDPTNLYTGNAQQIAPILKDLPQLAFGHGPTVAALGNRTAPQGYKRGGLAGHQPEFITGATGHYVKGKGDGQSDDIPAMLADGEYVFDADTVAALGNGSSDAGAERLDEMRQAIRKHKRSAPIDKIPPKAKSPLEYLKG